MRRLAEVLFLGFLMAGISSCKRCATCTSTVTDPYASVGDTITVDFCERGHVYDNQLETYERSGWLCVEE